MKALSRFAVLAAALLVASFLAVAEGKPLFSTTIDFLDYAFSDPETRGLSHYPLELYERRIREMAEGGIRKIYLRVNVCGLTLYPTKASAIYGTDGAFHWAELEQSRRLINTLAQYDPLAETIRLGRKYGLEVWCWENLCDESAKRMSAPAQFREQAAKLDFMPLLDPCYRKHPEYQAMRNPALVLDPDTLRARNAEARRHPIARIVLTDTVKMPAPVKITHNELQIYTTYHPEIYDIIRR